MDIIKKFNFGDNNVTIYGTIEQPYFKGREIAQILEYQNTTKAIIDHVDDDDKKRLPNSKHNESLPSLNHHPHTLFINESGVYSLIFGSKKSIAKEFKHWVTSEVLPAIRKNGHFNFKPPSISTYHVMHITNESELHNNVVRFIRQHQSKYSLKIVVPLGELQDTTQKRLDAWNKGYVKGQPDIIINNSSIHHNGLIIEFKSPSGKGILSEAQLKVIAQYKLDGFITVVSNDFAEIIRRLTLYFSRLRLKCQYCSHKFITAETRKKHYKFFHRMAIIS